MSAPRFRPYPGERGIGGFLLLFLLVQLLALAMLLLQTRAVLDGLPGSWALGETMAFMRPALVVESLMNLVRVVGIPIGLLLVLRHSPGARIFWKILLATTIIGAALDVVLLLRLYAGVHAQLTAIGASTEGIATQRWRGVANDVRLALHAAIWLAYWSVSERVRLTFAPRPAAAPTPA